MSIHVHVEETNAFTLYATSLLFQTTTATSACRRRWRSTSTSATIARTSPISYIRGHRTISTSMRAPSSARSGCSISLGQCARRTSTTASTSCCSSKALSVLTSLSPSPSGVVLFARITASANSVAFRVSTGARSSELLFQEQQLTRVCPHHCSKKPQKM